MLSVLISKVLDPLSQIIHSNATHHNTLSLLNLHPGVQTRKQTAVQALKDSKMVVLRVIVSHARLTLVSVNCAAGDGVV